MKIFIFGSNGMLGNYVQSYLYKSYKIIKLTRQDYDLNNLSINSLRNFLLEKNIESCDIIINCAGIIPQSSKQKSLNTKIFFKINSLFPVVLSMLCNEFKSKFIHITTDCVFSGENSNYNENSIHDETNDYGLSKSLGEICEGTIIRTSIIGEEINNKRSLLEWAKSNKDKNIKGYTNHYWNGVTCLQLAKIIKNMIDKDILWNGVRHIFSPNPVNKYQLLSYINEIYELNINIENFKTEIKIDKTISSIYENLFQIPDIKDQILEMKQFIL